MIAGIDVARLPLDLPLRCRCGHVRGIASNVSPSKGFRFVCYCKDCQAFAHFLERPDVLDLLVRFRSSHRFYGTLACELRNRGPLATL